MRARHAHPDALSAQAKLTALNLPFMRENYQPLANTAADKHWSHLDYFAELLNGLEQWMEEHEYESAGLMVGALSLRSCPDSEAYERGNYLRTLQLWRN